MTWGRYIPEFETGSTRSHFLERSIWMNRCCRRTDYVTMTTTTTKIQSNCFLYRILSCHYQMHINLLPYNYKLCFIYYLHSWKVYKTDSPPLYLIKIQFLEYDIKHSSPPNAEVEAECRYTATPLAVPLRHVRDFIKM
jgi:hypothetical protein